MYINTHTMDIDILCPSTRFDYISIAIYSVLVIAIGIIIWLAIWLNSIINEKNVCVAEKTTCQQSIMVEKDKNAIDTMKEFLAEYIPKVQIYQAKMLDIVSIIDSDFKAGKDMTNDYLLFTDTKNGGIRESLEPIPSAMYTKMNDIDETLRAMNTEESNKLHAKYFTITVLKMILNNDLDSILNMCVYNNTCSDPLNNFKQNVNPRILANITPIIPEIQPYP